MCLIGEGISALNTQHEMNERHESNCMIDYLELMN
jgi:hypothetical protein